MSASQLSLTPQKGIMTNAKSPMGVFNTAGKYFLKPNPDSTQDLDRNLKDILQVSSALAKPYNPILHHQSQPGTFPNLFTNSLIKTKIHRNSINGLIQKSTTGSSYKQEKKNLLNLNHAISQNKIRSGEMYGITAKVARKNAQRNMATQIKHKRSLPSIPIGFQYNSDLMDLNENSK